MPVQSGKEGSRARAQSTLPVATSATSAARCLFDPGVLLAAHCRALLASSEVLVAARKRGPYRCWIAERQLDGRLGVGLARRQHRPHAVRGPQTYEPLRTVLVLSDLPSLWVADWVPATPDNIAKATDDSIPAGYTKVDDGH